MLFRSKDHNFLNKSRLRKNIKRYREFCESQGLDPDNYLTRYKIVSLSLKDHKIIDLAIKHDAAKRTFNCVNKIPDNTLIYQYEFRIKYTYLP